MAIRLNTNKTAVVVKDVLKQIDDRRSNYLWSKIPQPIKRSMACEHVGDGGRRLVVATADEILSVIYSDAIPSSDNADEVADIACALLDAPAGIAVRYKAAKQKRYETTQTKLQLSSWIISYDGDNLIEALQEHLEVLEHVQPGAV